MITAGQTPKKIPFNAIEKITKLKAEFLGILINSITPNTYPKKDPTYAIYEQYAFNDSEDNESDEEIFKDEDDTSLANYLFINIF